MHEKPWLKYRCLCYTAASAEQVSAAVMAGQRPDLVEIKGPEDFEVFARTCVEKCWNDEPQQRPTFDGEITQPSIARASEQLDPRCCMQIYHRPNQLH